MTEHSHRGAEGNSPFRTYPDARVRELSEDMRELEAAGHSLAASSFRKDSHRVLGAAASPLATSGLHLRGVVIHPLPGVDWYKVQVGSGLGWVAACRLSPAGIAGVGPRELPSIRPNDDVLLLQVPGLEYAIILGVMPKQIFNSAVQAPDWISQGTPTGLRRESLHTFPIKNGYAAGGVIDWSNGRPLDATGYETGWVCPTGVMVSYDDFGVQLRVDERTGLWLSVIDSWCRLAGHQLLIESGCHEVDAGIDEGESKYFKGIAAYPYEALGLMSAAQELTAEISDVETQFEKARGKVDLPEGKEDTQPFYRYQEYGGYLGQGGLRAVVAPPEDPKVFQFRDETVTPGLFRETIGLDGGYSLLSAVSVHIGRRAKILVPKRIRPDISPEGDDAENDNYKFSGEFGAGDEHKVSRPLMQDGPGASLRMVGAATELATWEAAWQAIHPFHYHKLDFHTPNEGDEESGPITRVHENIDFSEVAFSAALSPPLAKNIRVDRRYGQVSVIEREQFLRINPDGSIHIADAFGSEIIMAGGHIDLRCPGGVRLAPGTDVVLMGDQIILRAKGSVDVSSGKDLRLEADNNLHALAGNSGNGGVLIESRSTGTAQDYKNKYGEDVVSSGIVLKARDSVVSTLSKDAYIRTIGGDVLLDADQGNGRCDIYSSDMSVYLRGDVTFAFGPANDTSDVTSTTVFSEHRTTLPGDIFFEGRMTGYGESSGIRVNGSVIATGMIATSGRVSDGTGGLIGKVPENFIEQVRAPAAAARTEAERSPPRATARHKADVVSAYYEEGGLGNQAAIDEIVFSFRDPPNGDQYSTDGLVWLESRWQQMARLEMGEGGEPWEAIPVMCQGAETFPWPGRKKWKEDDAAIRLKELSYFDADKGTATDRPGPYERATPIEFEEVKMSDVHKLMR